MSLLVSADGTDMERSCLEQVRMGGQYSLTMLRIKSNAKLDNHTQVSKQNLTEML